MFKLLLVIMFEGEGLVVIAKDGCIYCDMLKEFLFQQNTPYKLYDSIDVDIEAIKRETGHKTYPFVFIDGGFVGGYQEYTTYNIGF